MIASQYTFSSATLYIYLLAHLRLKAHAYWVTQDLPQKSGFSVLESGSLLRWFLFRRREKVRYRSELPKEKGSKRRSERKNKRKRNREEERETRDDHTCKDRWSTQRAPDPISENSSYFLLVFPKSTYLH